MTFCCGKQGKKEVLCCRKRGKREGKEGLVTNRGLVKTGLVVKRGLLGRGLVECGFILRYILQGDRSAKGVLNTVHKDPSSKM